MTPHFRDVPIPALMKDRPLDPRGYPIPWNILIDSTGKAHFTINNEELRQMAIRDRLCPICGVRLWKAMWFVGGPGSALHEQGAYIDPPMHKECATYALRVCPYLAAPNYSNTKRIDAKTLSPAERAKIPVLIDNTMDPERPALFVMAMTTKMDVTYNSYLRPHRPWKAMEFWRFGERLDHGAGMFIANNELARKFPHD
jgi:hypothetical protein